MMVSITQQLLDGSIHTPPSELGANDLNALMDLANKAYRLKSFEDARDILHGALLCDAKDPEAWALLAQTEVELGQVDDAYVAFEKSFELDESRVQSAVALAELCFEKGVPQRAQAWVDHALHSPNVAREDLARVDVLVAKLRELQP